MKISYLKYFYILLIVFILSILGSFAFFSWGSDDSNNTNVSFDVVAETVYIEYDAGSDIEGANLYPVDDKSDGISKDITVKTDKVSSKPVTFNLYLDLTDVPEELMDDSFKWAIYRDNELVASDSITKNIVGCSKNNTNHIVLVNNETVNTTLKKYTLYLWIDGNMTNPDTMMNKSFKVKLHADGNNALIHNLFNVMKKQAILDNKKSVYVNSDTGIDFSQISSDTNGKGIYIKGGTENDTYPIYYYRGAVDNNNVIFANFCWKIVRTTETGGIKLLYNGISNNGTCNNSSANTIIGTSAYNTTNNSLAYVGYMYGTPYITNTSNLDNNYLYGTGVTYSGSNYTLTNTQTGYNSGLTNHHYTCDNNTLSCSSVKYIYYTSNSIAYYITLTNGEKIEDAISKMLDNNITDSTIKTYIDNWYNTNMTNYTNKLEDTIWCNDRSIFSKGGWDATATSITENLRFSGYNRIYTKKELNLNCDRDIDKFTVSTNNGNGKLKYPVGLLTADEIMLAGSGGNHNGNTNYYIYNNESYWIGTSYSFYNNYGSSFLIDGSSGTLRSYNLDATNVGVRPSISLKSSNIISSGTGEANSPFIIK